MYVCDNRHEGFNLCAPNVMYTPSKGGEVFLTLLHWQVMQRNLKCHVAVMHRTIQTTLENMRVTGVLRVSSCTPCSCHVA